MKKLIPIALAALLSTGAAKAQLSTNPDKFLGNITTRYQIDYNGFQYYKYWNQITCENESKWGSVEGTNGSFNWGMDNAYNYAKQHNFPFKWHALIWGAQHPGWFNSSMAPEQRYKEIVQWMDAIKKKYPNLEIIDVANECISGHQADTYLFAEALGGGGATGWDWLAKAFELAHERWPNAILIYNDFNTFQWNTDQFIEICKTLRDVGAPIDAYGCQSHDLTNFNVNSFKNVMNKLQTSLKMPMYSTEYDIDEANDANQLKCFKEQIPVMWEADYCAGITLWGWHYGCTWVTASGIINTNKTTRPAMDWLVEYMKTDKAKNAKSPFPGMKKEASVYIKPQSLNIEKGTASAVTVRARMATKTIEKVDLYEGTTLIGTLTEGQNGQYVFAYAPTATGEKELRAVVTCTDGYTWTRYSNINVCDARAPYKGKPTVLPGTLQFENFDSGADGIAFHDNNSQKQGTGKSYRSDTGGIDVETGGTGYCVGYTEKGEWMEYTLDVKEAGYYNYDISYSSPVDAVTFNMQLNTEDGLKMLTAAESPLAKTGSWSTFKTAHGRLLLPLQEGKNVLRFNIVGGAEQYVTNLDKITFKRVDVNEDIKLGIVCDPAVSMVGTKTQIAANVESEVGIKDVTFYVNGVKNKSVTAAPYEMSYSPSVKGVCVITAVATDNDSKESPIATYNLTVTAKRSAYKGVTTVPGVVEAENFDIGEEGLTYHDDDTEIHDDAKYRTENPKPGVDVVAGNGGYVIGWTASNEWVEYTIEVANPGLYTCEMTASNGTSTSASVNFSLVGADGKLTTLWSLSCAGTGAWGTYKVRKSSVKKELQPGKQVIRVTFKNGNVNLDNFELKCVEDWTPIEQIFAEKNQPVPVGIFNLSGQKVDDGYRGIVVKNGKKFWQR